MCSSYMAYACISDLAHSVTGKNEQILDACIKASSLNQFIGVQRLEEHYYPASLSFGKLFN